MIGVNETEAEAGPADLPQYPKEGTPDHGKRDERFGADEAFGSPRDG